MGKHYRIKVIIITVVVVVVASIIIINLLCEYTPLKPHTSHAGSSITTITNKYLMLFYRYKMDMKLFIFSINRKNKAET